MDTALIAQLCAGTVLLAVGVMLIAVSSWGPGLVLTAGACWWLVRSVRRL